jgi:hypothetical protein
VKVTPPLPVLVVAREATTARSLARGSLRRGELVIEVSPFKQLTAVASKEFERAAAEYGRFLGKPVRVTSASR